jgi:hypothetical protein
MDEILIISGLWTIEMNISLLASMKQSFLSDDISVELRSISKISHECSILVFKGFPDMISNILIILGFEVSIRAITSDESEIVLLFKNSTLSPYYFGYETILPS